ncbi:hypothetical protein [Actinoplanes philippinensis]|uniref:hypothetical protein n=1 Tax=Actinoplanes philippinensis TaxID=35752 RepID=UPI0033F9FA16
MNGWDRHVLDTYFGAPQRVVFNGPRVGDRVHLIPELGGAAATVKNVDPTGEALSVELPGGKVVALGTAAIRQAMKWKAGDVVIVRYSGPDSTPYTYVRGAHSWPGEARAAKTDALMTKLYFEGKVTPVLQAGGTTFATDRLA